MKLYSNGPGNVFAQTALIAADLANQAVTVEYKDKAAANEKTFKAKNTTGKFPLLELESGDLLWESGAIALHFARCAPKSGLLGQTPFQAAQVEQWIAYTQTTIWPALMPVVYAAFGINTVPQDEFTKAVSVLKGKAKLLNDQLKGKSFLVGDNLTVADVVAACSLIVAFQTVFDAKYRKSMPALSAWFERCVGLPSFVRRLGYVKMTENAFKAWDPKAKVEPVKAAAPAKKADDYMDDLFGSDDEDDGAAAAAAAAAKAAATKAKKPKKVVIAMSLVMLEVKPMDDTIDLDALAKKIFAEITQEGLYWKTEFKKEPVAFGIFKLIVGFSLEDDKVSVDDVVERIEGLEDLV
jgi:glutathione S-transferase/translation elongation factor EF-1beta